MKLPITVVVPVKNEERNLPHFFDALRGAFHQVVVVDSSSTDRTVAIAVEHGAKVIQFEWNGRYPKKRNWTLRHFEFETPWVLFLDADEFVTPEFIAELGKKLPVTHHSGFWLSFENWFMGAPLRHGDPFQKLALFRVDAGEYERFPEDSWCDLDMEVHEHPVLSGDIGKIISPIQHHDYRGLRHYIAKHNEYSSWEARRFLWLEAQGPDVWQSLTKRQRFKYRNLDRWWLAWTYFLASYGYRRGFLDGRQGWVFNCMKLRYFIDIRLKINEHRRVCDTQGKAARS